MRRRTSTSSTVCDSSYACPRTPLLAPSMYEGATSSAASGASTVTRCAATPALGRLPQSIAARAIPGTRRPTAATPINADRFIALAPLPRAQGGSLAASIKTKPGTRPGFVVSPVPTSSVLDVQLRAAVARAAVRVVRTVVIGVRRDRAALAVTGRTHHARRIDAVRGQVVVHRGRAALRQRLVVRVGALRVGVASHFDLQLRVTLQDLDRLVEDRHRVRTQGRLVEVEVHALQVDRHRHRAAVRTNRLARLRIRAAVVAIVHAVTVAV